MRLLLLAEFSFIKFYSAIPHHQIKRYRKRNFHYKIVVIYILALLDSGKKKSKVKIKHPSFQSTRLEIQRAVNNVFGNRLLDTTLHSDS